MFLFLFFFSSRRRHTRLVRDWSSDVCSSDLLTIELIANCIYAVKAPESEEITDSDMIKEWLQSITKTDYDVIRERVEELSDSGFEIGRASCRERV